MRRILHALNRGLLRTVERMDATPFPMLCWRDMRDFEFRWSLRRLRARAIEAGLLVLLLAAPAAAQDPPPPTFEPGVMLAYNLGDLESDDPLSGLSLELDASFRGLPISFVGHVSRTEPSNFTGAGVRVTHDIGPFEVFGHYLFGQAEVGGTPADGISQKRGGGANVPLGDGLFLRMGADHHADILHSVIGLGYTW